MKTFQKKKEDFRCERCTSVISGDGYTNHCPKCLWSKHVDIFPGDRAASCGGLMEPVAFEHAGKNDTITHRCFACGYEKKNKVAKNDDFEALLVLSRHFANR
ncbi:MAG: RNHCP domain-containing protein [Candidatus Moranbacteria bacterium]|nr:RNHCP domain-containing protein [Candidatus Moranbacteria bacterium]